MDFFTFIIIGVAIYSFFSKKNKAPQRTRRPAEQTFRQPEVQQPSRPIRKKEGFFESIERQIRESAEALEKELDPGKGEKTAAKRTSEKIPEKARRGSIPRPALNQESYEGVEGAWGTEGRSGVEGRSDYSKYQSTQGKGRQDKRADTVIEQTSVESGAYAIGTESEGLQKAVGFSSSEIVQGVIWAEILKQPRGMRSYSRK